MRYGLGFFMTGLWVSSLDFAILTSHIAKFIRPKLKRLPQLKRWAIRAILLWTLGVGGWLAVVCLFMLGRIKIRGYGLRKLFSRRGLIILSNHPSLLEPVILPFLFLPIGLIWPRRMPMSTPDESNYFHKTWYWPFRPFSIPIPRGSKRQEWKMLIGLKQYIVGGGAIILFPEAGRTFKGAKFLFSKSGEKIRRFPVGLRRLFDQPKGYDILFIWVRGTDKALANRSTFADHGLTDINTCQRIEIIFGKRMKSEDLLALGSPKKIIPFLEKKLLDLSSR